jgi:hypothetical protein
MAGEAGSFIGSVVGTLFTAGMAISDAKKQKELEDKLANLSLAQQTELENQLNSTMTILGKQKKVLEYVGMQNEADAIAKIQNKKYISIGVVALIFVGLGFIFVKLSKK